jgi:transcriptional regulator with XRE-family HTH domain
MPYPEDRRIVWAMDDLNLGERIVLMRRRRHMTQNQLAAIVDVAPSEIHRLETGVVKDPHASRIVALARALQVSSDWLLGIRMD